MVVDGDLDLGLVPARTWGGEDGGEPGQLVAFWHDWEVRSVKSPSFEVWLRQLADSMEDGTLECV